MLAFEIKINGKKKCVAGISEPGVVTTTLTWVLGQERRRGRSGTMGLRVGGLVSNTNEFLEWYHRRMRRGDQVSIRIVEADEADVPRKRRKESASKKRRRLQAYVKQMAKKFGWKVVTQ